jgi:hypothetical protein
MRFVVDDAPWAPASVAPEELERALDALSDRLLLAHERGESAAIYDDLWEAKLVGEISLHQLLFEPGGPLGSARDVRQRLSRQLDQLSGRIEVMELPALDAKVQDSVLFSPSAVYAWARAGERVACACLTPPTSGRHGELPAEVSGEAHPVHYVDTEAAHVGFFRAAIALENADEDRFAELAPSAFPELDFAEGVWRGLRDLSRPFRDLREELIHHLGVLNDHGARIFALKRNELIEAEFGSVGVLLSPENIATLNDSVARRARLREHRGETLLFDWHLKLERHQDRIHVHPGKDGRVVVGIIHRHLPLPGD